MMMNSKKATLALALGVVLAPTAAVAADPPVPTTVETAKEMPQPRPVMRVRTNIDAPIVGSASAGEDEGFVVVGILEPRPGEGMVRITEEISLTLRRIIAASRRIPIDSVPRIHERRAFMGAVSARKLKNLENQRVNARLRVNGKGYFELVDIEVASERR